MATALSAQKINVYYGASHALQDVSLDFEAGGVTALIGPSGCGKSTFLRCLNRMNDLIPGCRVEGRIMLDGEDVNQPRTNVVRLRQKVGMVFQKPNPFPKSIFENVAYGLRVNGVKDENLITEKVELALRRAALWNEVEDRLSSSALAFPAASSNACASPVPWPWNRRCCSWTSPPAPWTPSPPARWKRASWSSRKA